MVIYMDNEKKFCVLIVDDDASNLIELNHILKSEYKIRTAKDGLAILKYVERFMPDIILLDVVMPVKSGFEVISELKNDESSKDIPVIFITGARGDVKENEGLALGAVDYIYKPFTRENVKRRIKQQLENSGAQV